jgi:hypothetical protein
VVNFTKAFFTFQILKNSSQILVNHTDFIYGPITDMFCHLLKQTKKILLKTQNISKKLTQYIYIFFVKKNYLINIVKLLFFKKKKKKKKKSSSSFIL